MILYITNIKNHDGGYHYEYYAVVKSKDYKCVYVGR